MAVVVAEPLRPQAQAAVAQVVPLPAQHLPVLAVLRAGPRGLVEAADSAVSTAPNRMTARARIGR